MQLLEMFVSMFEAVADMDEEDQAAAHAASQYTRDAVEDFDSEDNSLLYGGGQEEGLDADDFA